MCHRGQDPQIRLQLGNLAVASFDENFLQFIAFAIPGGKSRQGDLGQRAGVLPAEDFGGLGLIDAEIVVEFLEKFVVLRFDPPVIIEALDDDSHGNQRCDEEQTHERATLDDPIDHKKYEKNNGKVPLCWTFTVCKGGISFILEPFTDQPTQIITMYSEYGNRLSVLVESWLRNWIFSQASGVAGLEPIKVAMNYSLLSKSKRFRPVLYLTTLELFGQPVEHGRRGALALECIHTYSLIHDDLPCMDDDDMRRGQLSSHKKFGEAAAVLCGDGLQSLAFELLAGEPEGVAGRMCGELARAAGANGMVAGQWLDMEYTGKVVRELDKLQQIHHKKTGALIGCALSMAGIRCHLSDLQISQLRSFGQKLGLMFQIKDDILDVISRQDALGKTGGKDAEQGKLTFPALLGLQGAETTLKDLMDEGRSDLERLGLKHTELQNILTFLLHRKS